LRGRATPGATFSWRAIGRRPINFLAHTGFWLLAAGLRPLPHRETFRNGFVKHRVVSSTDLRSDLIFISAGPCPNERKCPEMSRTNDCGGTFPALPPTASRADHLGRGKTPFDFSDSPHRITF
jgi:hypothetical protein